MDRMDYGNTMIWISIQISFPVTLMVLSLSCAVRLDQTPVTYYMNLLVSNLIQLGTLVVLTTQMKTSHPNFVFLLVFGCGAISSLCFRTVIALERYFFVSRPQLLFIRQTKGLVMICVSVWVVCLVILPLSVIFHQRIVFLFFPLLLGPVFTTCSARIFKFLPAATSVPVEQKRRIVGILFLLMIIYVFMIFPICFHMIQSHFDLWYQNPTTSLTLFLLSPLMDLLLLAFMCEGPVDQLLSRCCRMENAAEEENRSAD